MHLKYKKETDSFEQAKEVRRQSALAQDGSANRKELAIVRSLEAEFCGKVTRSDSVGISEASV